MPMESPLDALLDGRTKGFPAAAGPLRLGQLGSMGWNVLAEDLPLPLAVLKETALRAQLRLDAGFPGNDRSCPRAPWQDVDEPAALSAAA